jgi:hypothetical protein
MFLLIVDPTKNQEKKNNRKIKSKKYNSKHEKTTKHQELDPDNSLIDSKSQ